LYKIELSFSQEFGTKVLPGGWKFVTLMVQTLVRTEQRFVMNVNMRLICMFWVKHIRRKKPNFVCCFRF